MVDDGRIIDADIELNAVDNHFYDASTEPPPPGARRPLDLWNTLSHELGHLQGLDHTCRNGPGDGMPACTVDDQGGEIVSCDTVEQGQTTSPSLAAIFATTMYPTSTAGDVEKRMPKDDDVRGVAAVYPASAAATACPAAPPDLEAPVGSAGRHGCSVSAASTGDHPVAVLGWLGLIVACAARRAGQRRARARPTPRSPTTHRG
jgi:hypothetical protein